jgi:hypothetical protein
LLWGLVAVGLIGLLLGLRFRAPALIMTTALTVLVRLLIGSHGAMFQLSVLWEALILALALQVAYLLGLLLATLGRRLSAGRGGPGNKAQDV